MKVCFYFFVLIVLFAKENISASVSSSNTRPFLEFPSSASFDAHSLDSPQQQWTPSLEFLAKFYSLFIAKLQKSQPTTFGVNSELPRLIESRILQQPDKERTYMELKLVLTEEGQNQYIKKSKREIQMYCNGKKIPNFYVKRLCFYVPLFLLVEIATVLGPHVIPERTYALSIPVSVFCIILLLDVTYIYALKCINKGNGIPFIAEVYEFALKNEEGEVGAAPEEIIPDGDGSGTTRDFKRLLLEAHQEALIYFQQPQM